jgi:antibiotic biosynthesis monooxygenase (ABM) superfamily enzyme
MGFVFYVFVYVYKKVFLIDGLLLIDFTLRQMDWKMFLVNLSRTICVVLLLQYWMVVWPDHIFVCLLIKQRKKKVVIIWNLGLSSLSGTLGTNILHCAS